MAVRAGPPAGIRWVIILGVLFSFGWMNPGAAATSLTIYTYHTGTPAAIPNFVNPGAGCDWWGVGGQVFNGAGRPEPGLLVRITGTVDGRAIDRTVVTGSSLGFGPGGYDLQLADHLPAAAALSLQLFDSAGRAQSGPSPLPFYRTCSQNLTVVNLRQRTFNRLLYLPLSRR